LAANEAAAAGYCSKVAVPRNPETFSAEEGGLEAEEVDPRWFRVPGEIKY